MHIFDNAFTCNRFPAADDTHVPVVPGEDELAADAHVEAGHHHDAARDHAPHQQPEERPREYYQIGAYSKGFHILISCQDKQKFSMECILSQREAKIGLLPTVQDSSL